MPLQSCSGSSSPGAKEPWCHARMRQTWTTTATSSSPTPLKWSTTSLVEDVPLPLLSQMLVVTRKAPCPTRWVALKRHETDTRWLGLLGGYGFLEYVAPCRACLEACCTLSSVFVFCLPSRDLGGKWPAQRGPDRLKK